MVSPSPSLLLLSYLCMHVSNHGLNYTSVGMSGALGLTRSMVTYQSQWACEPFKFLKSLLLLNLICPFLLLDSHSFIRY